MLSFHKDPKIAEQQMHAIIFSLAAFGYIDGDFARSEKEYIRTTSESSSSSGRETPSAATCRGTAHLGEMDHALLRDPGQHRRGDPTALHRERR